jgi:PAS domain S-box-containing protein
LEKLVYANEIAFEITGYTKEDLAKGVCAFDFFDQKDQERIRENFRKALTNKPSEDAEYTFVGKDGTTFPVIIKRNPIVVGNKTVGLRGIAIGISERKKTEEETTFLASIVQNSDDAIIGKSLDGTITSWNNGAEHVYGYSASEVIGKSIQILVPAEEQEEIIDILRGIRTGQQIKHYQTRRVRKDGAKIDVSLTISPIRSKEGAIIGASSIARDITEQKIADETLREAEEKYEALINAANVLVQSVNAEGRFIFVNEEWKKVLGYSVEDLKKITLMDVVRNDHFQYCMSVFKDVKNGACVRDVETVFVAKDRREIVVSGNACPIFKGGKFVSSVAFFVDITNRKKNEAQLKENSHRIEMMNEKLRVVGGLTRHDVRNKLSAVTAYAYLLKKKHSDQADIIDGLCKMEQAVNDSMKIFDFAKMYEQIGSEELSYVDVEEKVKEASDLFSVPLPIIKNECHGITLLADSFLRQLFYNFIDNTRKYGKKTTTIRVYFERADQDSSKLVYEDDGVGVPFENKPRLFSEGFSTGGSTGFGLFLTKKMIDVCGWTISEDGEPGKGAKFVITIPKLNKNGKENY